LIAVSNDDGFHGLVSFDGRSWATHLADKYFRDAAAAPDGSVWVSVEDDGVYAVRH